MRIGIKTPQFDVGWPRLAEAWEYIDQELTVFDSAWLLDHLMDPFGGTQRALEAWTLLSALAARTSRLTLGHLVLCAAFRNPALLALMTSTLQEVAHGRFVLGLGAGWFEPEHALLGIEMLPVRERIALVRSTIIRLREVWSTSGANGQSGQGFAAVAPIWLGLQGRRGLRLAAQFADGWNHFGADDDFRRKRAELAAACDEAGRDVGSMEISAQIALEGRDFRRLRTASIDRVRSGATHLVFVVPPPLEMPILTLLASEVANPLRDAFP